MTHDPPRRWQVVTSWVLQILMAVLFALQGVAKLGGSPNWVTRFRHWGYPEKFYLVIGATELIGAAILLIPRTAAYGALLLMAVMTGAMVTHLLHREPQFLTTVVLFAVLAFVVYVRRAGLLRLRQRADTSHE